MTSFEKTLQQADVFLEQADRVETVDLKALALCGLAVSNNEKTYVDRAKRAFARARSITQAKGRVDHVLKLFDQIEALDKKGLLAELRDAAAGVKP